ncbi:hypothetical protein QOT17_008144 [Balamuthia mandrillaris]
MENKKEPLEKNPRVKIEQLVREALSKMAHTIVGARVAALSQMSSKKNKWFNLDMEESDIVTEQLNAWKNNIYLPLILETFFVTKDRQTRALLEHWRLSYQPLNKSPRVAIEIPTVYKKLVVLIRSLYSFLRMLPAHQLYRDLQKHERATAQISYLMRQDAEGGPSFNNAPTSEFNFGHVKTPFGKLALYVRYRHNCSHNTLAPENCLDIKSPFDSGRFHMGKGKEREEDERHPTERSAPIGIPTANQGGIRRAQVPVVSPSRTAGSDPFRILEEELYAYMTPPTSTSSSSKTSCENCTPPFQCYADRSPPPIQDFLSASPFSPPFTDLPPLPMMPPSSSFRPILPVSNTTNNSSSPRYHQRPRAGSCHSRTASEGAIIAGGRGASAAAAAAVQEPPFSFPDGTLTLHYHRGGQHYNHPLGALLAEGASPYLLAESSPAFALTTSQDKDGELGLFVRGCREAPDLQMFHFKDGAASSFKVMSHYEALNHFRKVLEDFDNLEM